MDSFEFRLLIGHATTITDGFYDESAPSAISHSIFRLQYKKCTRVYDSHKKCWFMAVYIGHWYYKNVLVENLHY